MYMNDNLTEIVFILDRSGSMSGQEVDTIGGFNAMLERQKKEPGAALLSTVLFNGHSEVLHDRVDLQKVEPLTEQQYQVGGNTALLDAVGGAIHHIGNVHKYAREEDRPGKTIFIITTDGMENASRFYSSEKVRHMVKHEQEKYGWEFLFLGADIDAFAVGHDFGIKAERIARYKKDHAGTRLNFEAVDYMLADFRISNKISDDWSKPIDDHFREDEK